MVITGWISQRRAPTSEKHTGRHTCPCIATGVEAPAGAGVFWLLGAQIYLLRLRTLVGSGLPERVAPAAAAGPH